MMAFFQNQAKACAVTNTHNPAANQNCDCTSVPASCGVASPHLLIQLL